MDRNQIIKDMMKGFEALDEYWDKNQLSFFQNTKIFLITIFIFVCKFTLKPVRKLLGKKFSFKKGLDQATNFKLGILGNQPQDTPENGYLTIKEIVDFQNTGIHGPFKAIDREEALSIGEYSDSLYKNNFDNQIILSDDIINALKDSNQYSINYSGLFQAQNYLKLWNTLGNNIISKKIVSLLGEDIICWRSQFFEKTPQSMGTFWHQTGTFRESSSKPKLIPTQKTDEGMVQLTAWIALRDSTIKNGCMRFLKGSHTDGRFERLIYNILEDKIGFLMSCSYKEIRKVLKTLMYTSGNFLKAQLMFEIAIDKLPDLFEGMEVIDVEMKAGEAIIFTSLNVHASHPNTTSDQTRLAFAGRYTRSDVHVYKDFSEDVFPTRKGSMSYPLDQVGCIPIHGTPVSDGVHNKIMDKPVR